MSRTQWQVADIPQIIVLLAKTFFRDQGVVNSAALTYTTLFSIVPLMTVSYAMLAAVPSFQGVGNQIESWIFSNFIPSTGSQVQSYLSGFASQARSLTLVGLFFLFVTAIMMIKNIEAAFNRIWHIQTGRKGLSSFLIYWAVLTLGPLLVGAGMALSSYLIGLAQLDKLDQLSGFRLLSLLPWLLTAAAFTLIYAVVPNCRVPWRSALIAGVMAALVFELAKRGFAFFVASFPSYQLVYGAFAAVPLFLVWIYICWSIILLGAVLSRILSGQVSSAEEAALRPAVLLELLDRLYRYQQQGERVSAAQLDAEVVALNRQTSEAYLELLLEMKIVAQDENRNYFVCRDLSQIRLEDLSRHFARQLWVEAPQTPWAQELARLQQRVSEAEQPILALSLKQLFERSAPLDEADSRG